MKKLLMLDPRVPVDAGDRPLIAPLDSLEGRVIGILDNGQANSTPMFHELASLLRERYRPSDIVVRKKPTHMQGAPREMIEELARRSDAVITGLGA
ncbi:MAG TPA: hypothetical protein VNL14_09115 [Candidatus Acidoferrales bacterium]|nr:hypothetical protein [Candidatus Acidoferrales bacterium]